MITQTELLIAAQEKLADAEALYNAGRYDSAFYICGYAVEMLLKYKICKTLNWNDFPMTNREFDNYKSLKIHNLEVLLTFTGAVAFVQNTYTFEWGAVKTWNPEMRYAVSGIVNRAVALDMISSTRTLITII